MFLNKSKKRSLLFVIFFACLVNVKAQQKTIRINGIVKNEKNEAVYGATVQVSRSKLATQTDDKGNFSIEAPEKEKVIISYIGYETITVVANAKLDILLKPAVNTLSDVVVIGYGSQKRKELTGAISTVSSKDFQRGSITTPEQLIAGKVAGVSVTSNGGSPGAGSTIRIRGGASLNASNDPLIVIDGVPLSGNNIYGSSNSLSLINPNDIESFTVLRDASATAIYGSRASNGVILITTKKGLSGKPVYTFTTQVSVSSIRKYVDVMSAGEFRKYVDSLGNETFDSVHTYKSLLGNANTNWQKEIYQTALGTDNYFGVAGAWKNVPYRLSLGYYRHDGILKTDNLQRVTGGISLNPKLLDNHLKIEINIKGAVNNTRFANGGAISSSAYFDPTQPVKVPTDHDNYYGDYFEWTAIDPGTGALTLNKLAPKNPLALLYLYKNISEVQRSYGNIQFDYRFHGLPDLRANLNLGYDVAKGSGTVQVPRYAAQNFLEKGQNNKYSNRIKNTAGEFYLNYTKNLNLIKSNINLTGGTGYYRNLSINDNYYNLRYNNDTIPGSAPVFPDDKPENLLISYYGRLIYTFNTKYILAASIRTDGSSKFSKDNRWGVFPSIAMTWRINEEKFLKNSKKISDLKLRVSYGVTGQQDGIANYSYEAVYSSSDNSSLTQLGNAYYNMGTPSAYDKSIKWEQTTALNIGLDFGFIDNRISGSIDLYKRKTKDLLNDIPLPSGSNFSSHIITNIGDVENKGIELTLNLTPVRNKKITWDVSFNAAYNINKIAKLTATDNPAYPGTQKENGVQINSIGYAPNSFYLYHQQYDVAGKPVEGVYRDINNDGIVNERDLYHYQSDAPKYVLGFTTQVSWKQWSLNTVLRANIGNYVYNGISTSAVNSGIFNPLGFIQNSLRNVTYSGFKDNQRLSDYYVENASFLKMDNIQLAYNAGKFFHNKADLKLSANCQNVFTITKYTGLDPEVFGGVDYILYPRPRIYVLALTLQF